MANTKSAKKRIRQTEKRTARNRQYISGSRTHIKKVRKLIAEGKLDEAEQAANVAYSTLDKAGRKRILHPKNASRRKGRLMAALAAARQGARLEDALFVVTRFSGWLEQNRLKAVTTNYQNYNRV